MIKEPVAVFVDGISCQKQLNDLLSTQNIHFETSKALVKRLKVKNINEDRLTAVGYGETKPIADNKTKIGKAKNRRIEFKVIGD